MQKRGYMQRGYVQLRVIVILLGIINTGTVGTQRQWRPREIENWRDVVRVPLQDWVVFRRELETNTKFNKTSRVMLLISQVWDPPVKTASPGAWVSKKREERGWQLEGQGEPLVKDQKALTVHMPEREDQQEGRSWRSRSWNPSCRGKISTGGGSQFSDRNWSRKNRTIDTDVGGGRTRIGLKEFYLEPPPFFSVKQVVSTHDLFWEG